MKGDLLRLLLILLAVGIGLSCIVVYFMARMLLRPPRMTDGKAIYLLKRLSPEDLGLKFDPLSYDINGISSSAWWIPSAAPSDRCAVLIHGYGDAKVGAIAWARLLHDLGFNIFAFDLRAHGESGGSNSTGGFLERQDVSQLIDRVKRDRADQARQTVLFGISLGAAVAAAVGVLRKDISAVILESPFSDYRSAIHAHARLIGSPGPVFVNIAIRLAERIARVDFEQVRPVDLIPKINAPVMLIAAGDDPLVTMDSAEALKCAVARRTDQSIYWQIPMAYHVEGMLGNFEEYQSRLRSFLEGALLGPSQPPA